MLSALALVAPFGSAHAFWPSWGAAQKIEKAVAQEPLAKKAITEHLAKNAAIAAKGTASALGSVAVGTANFARKNPWFTVGAVATGYAYLKRNEIGAWCKKTYEENKPIIHTAAGLAALVGAGIVAKKAYNGWNNLSCALNTLSAQSPNSMNALPVMPKIEPPVAPQISSNDITSNIHDFNEIWDSYQADEAKRIAGEAAQRLAAAQARTINFDKQVISNPEVKTFNNIFEQAKDNQNQTIDELPKLQNRVDILQGHSPSSMTLAGQANSHSIINNKQNTNQEVKNWVKQFENENKTTSEVKEWVQEYEDKNAIDALKERMSQSCHDSDQEANELTDPIDSGEQTPPVVSLDDIGAYSARRSMDRIRNIINHICR